MKLYSEIASKISNTDFNKITERAEQHFITVFNNIKNLHIKKINKLLNPIEEETAEMTKDCDKWLINLTDTVIPENIKNVLRLGQNFTPVVEPSKAPLEKIICDVESVLINKNNDETTTELRNRFVNILTNYKFGNIHKKILTKEDIRLNKAIKTANNFIKTNNNLIITRADKGNITVVMNRYNYFEKGEEMLLNESISTKYNKN